MSNSISAQNSHSMRNTTVQPSQLNGGNFSQMFDLQAMRVVKGRVELNTKSAPQYYTVVNESDGYPLTLGSSEFIIGYGIINGNTNNVGVQGSIPYSSQPVTPIINSPVVQFILNPIPPQWDFLNNIWVPQNPTGLGVQTITPTFTTGSLGQIGTYINSGYGNLSPVIQNSCGIGSWLELTQTGYSFTMENNSVNAGAINITLLILN